MVEETRQIIKLGDLAVDAETGEILETTISGFVVDTPQKLSWWLGKMRMLRALAGSEDEVAMAAKCRALALGKAAESLETLFYAQAAVVARPLIPQGRRSIVLEGGECGFRKTPGGIEVISEETAIEWCKEHLPEAVKVRESLLKIPVGVYIKETGTAPPGVEMREGENKFWVK